MPVFFQENIFLFSGNRKTMTFTGLLVSVMVFVNYVSSSVGEDIILPRSVRPQKAITLGKFVSMSNIFSSNQTRRNRNLAGG